MREFFFFNDTATTEIYTLSLHDALPISVNEPMRRGRITGTDLLPAFAATAPLDVFGMRVAGLDRKSTRLNSSHANISYAVFCLKKKNMTNPALSDRSVCALPLSLIPPLL